MIREQTRRQIQLIVWILLVLLILLPAFPTADGNSGKGRTSEFANNIQKIDTLVHRWAPIIWLAPGEDFMPLGIGDFLDHVYAASDDGRVPISFSPRSMGEQPIPKIPQGRETKELFLHTKRNLESLKNETSFLHGVNPQKRSVPVYVTVTYCNSHDSLNDVAVGTTRTFYNPAKNFLKKIFYGGRREKQQKLDKGPRLNFYISYWLFFPYNEGKEVCFLGNIPAPLIFGTCFGKARLFGNHVGDFEHLTLSFKGHSYPDELFLSVHDTGVYYKYDRRKRFFRFDRQLAPTKTVTLPLSNRIKFPQIVRLSGDRAILFAAHGSHGLWASPGDHQYVRVPRLLDYTGYGAPWKTWRDLRLHRAGIDPPPNWMTYEGRWGNPKDNCLLFRKLGICELSDGPQGVLMRKQDFSCY